LNLLFGRPQEPPPEPEPEGFSFPATPYASLLTDMIEMGFTAPQVVYVVHLLELAQAKAELRNHAEMNLAGAQRGDSKPAQAPMSRPMSRRSHQNERRAKWRERKRNQRARLKLVHPTSEDAA
jgi:hypothetical protein